MTLIKDTKEWGVLSLVKVDEQNNYRCKYENIHNICEYINGKDCRSCAVMQGILAKLALVEELETELLCENCGGNVL